LKAARDNRDKELYRELRGLSCNELWEKEVSRFDRADRRERQERVAVVRAVGVVFAESGTDHQKEAVRSWLCQLLKDPTEKVRRYAIMALPKIGMSAIEEGALLALLRSSSLTREKDLVLQILVRMGEVATLRGVKSDAQSVAGSTKRMIEASLARRLSPGSLHMDSPVSEFDSVKIHLRCRPGLERIVRMEMEAASRRGGKFRINEVRNGLVRVEARQSFCLDDLYAYRCFSTVALDLGTVTRTNEKDDWQRLANLIGSTTSRSILSALTDGPIRYRLEFAGYGHQRSAIRNLADRVYAVCPEILNDSRSARWVIGIYPAARGYSLELAPKITPDPRFHYRRADIPAASYPPLAACLARLSGPTPGDVVWDPFCGSGLELIERALLGGVTRAFGTDLRPSALDIARTNWTAARLQLGQVQFVRSDFRDFEQIEGLRPKEVTLLITNPPMGRRVPVANLDRLINELFRVAATVLAPAGSLVFVNPVRLNCPDRCLKLQFRQAVDMGGFTCHVEKYVKAA
jgi:23S rRNA G2445 N2-methylase RlmL